MPTATDLLFSTVDQALRTVWGRHHAARPRPLPAPQDEAAELSPEQQALSGALMRVNHVGEVCAQALYTAQALSCRDEATRRQLRQAAAEEIDHLAWTEQRLTELGSRPSLLNPLWYAGAFALGWVAGRAAPARGLGFVIETERQVEAHLQSHLDRLPAADAASRAIVARMREDEAAHADSAAAAGGRRPPAPLRWAMAAAAKVMTTTAHRI
ncbi:MAG: 2-polyprenyl-3-methyl-6-methoxy-1,4-benzoquinone monooxygenase [Burkholderiaceae bacterium]|nr:2-polyprenyl-3-methyl-6-methoxy-1,4-benzoquinone monooxygenase [Burkholderiaceae bacterium]